MQWLRWLIQDALLAGGYQPLDVVGHSRPVVELASVHQLLVLARVLKMERCKDSLPCDFWDDDPTVVEQKSVCVLGKHGVPLALVALSRMIF